MAPCLWMGLDQVRDLRQGVIRAISATREGGPFRDVRDLMMRVSFQTKEISHLIQSGGLDGLGDSRAAMLEEARGIKASGSESQMTLGFASPSIPAESLAQSMAWERQVLGQPVSVHPLDLLDSVPDHLSYGDLPEHVGNMVSLVGVRLPGWTGGGGFYLGNQHNFVLVQGDKSFRMPHPWEPVHLRGRWRTDGMDTYWVQAESFRVLPTPAV